MRTDYSPFFRSTVGFDRLLNLLETAEGAPGYPPYNIERSDEDHYRITIAVAGFAEKDLGVEVKDNVLAVTGKREAEAEKPAYLHQGIAGRAFERQFQLAQHVVVKGAISRTACPMSSWSASCRKRRSPAASPSTRRS